MLAERILIYLHGVSLKICPNYYLFWNLFIIKQQKYCQFNWHSFLVWGLLVAKNDSIFGCILDE